MQGIEAARAATAHYDDPDVVIVGAGASGAAVAWSLAAAGFKVVCLEQGDWVNPQTLPPPPDRLGASPPHRLQRRPERARPCARTTRSTTTASTFSPLMFNAVGGSTIHWSAHFPRYHPSDFRVRSLDGVGDDWPLTYDELEPFYDLNDRMIGVAGLDRRPVPAAALAAPDAADPARAARRDDGARLRPARLALVAVRHRHHHGAVQRPAGLQQLRPVRPRLPDRRALQRRRDLLAAGAAARRRAADPLPRPRDHRGRAGPGARRPLLRRSRARSRSSAPRW